MEIATANINYVSKLIIDEWHRILSVFLDRLSRLFAVATTIVDEGITLVQVTATTVSLGVRNWLIIGLVCMLLPDKWKGYVLVTLTLYLLLL